MGSPTAETADLVVLLVGLLARWTTRTGRRITYITPISLSSEVALNVAALSLGAVVGTAAIAGLIVTAVAGSAAGVVASVVVGAAAAALTWRPAISLFRRDHEETRPKRQLRYPDDPTAW